jgi:hypothetical protein
MSGDEEASGDSSGADLSESMTQAHEREAITRALDNMVQVCNILLYSIDF